MPASPTDTYLPTVEITLVDRLTQQSLSAALAAIEDELHRGDRVHLVVDALAMTSYTTEARELFVQFARRESGRIARFSILTDRSLWRVVISAMSLASGVPMHAYPSRAEFHRSLRADDGGPSAHP